MGRDYEGSATEEACHAESATGGWSMFGSCFINRFRVLGFRVWGFWALIFTVLRRQSPDALILTIGTPTEEPRSYGNCHFL